MNKLIIRNIGYDFQKENIKYIKDLAPLNRLGLFYILPNYSILEDTRKDLTEELGGIGIENVMTFDDLSDIFSDKNKTYISRDEGAWILKKILEDKEDIKFSSSIGTAREILSFILEIKSNNINPSKFIDVVKNYNFPDLENIYKLYLEYEHFLESNDLEDEIGKYIYPIKNNKFSEFKNKVIIINGFIEFRPNELFLLGFLNKLGFDITIQLPFLTKKLNAKLNKTIKVLENLGYLKDCETYFEDNNQKLAYDIFSNDKTTYPVDCTLIKSTNKYYELREVFSMIKEDLQNCSLRDISIIIRDEYDPIIRKISKEENLPINVLSQEKASKLPLIKSVINYLELLKYDEKKKLISYFLDDNFNLKYKDNRYAILQELRSLDYKGIFAEYEDLSEELLEFFSDLKYQIMEFKKNPKERLKEIFSEDSLKDKALENFYIHSEESILSDLLTSIDILNENIENVINFSDIVKLSFEDILDILIDSFKDKKYYSKAVNGIKVLKGINSINSSSKIRYIVGLDSSYPSISSKGYLYSEQFLNIYRNMNMNFSDKFEDFDNNLLIYSDIVSNSEKLILSYIYEDPKLKENRSILVNDTLNRIQEDFKREVTASNIVKNKVTKLDNLTVRFIYDTNVSPENKEMNYFPRENLSRINNKLISYKKRKDLEESYWGEVDNYDDKINSKYSPKMLQYFNECPFRFYMKYVLKYEALELDYIDKFNLEKGNFYHLVLEYFFKEENYLNLSFEEIKTLIEKSIDRAIIELELKEISILQKNLVTRILTNYAVADINRQKSYYQVFKPTYFERFFSRFINNIEVKGRIDRIDLSQDNLAVITDYKSKNTPDKKDVFDLKDLQLPLYALLYGKENIMSLSYGNIEESTVSNHIFNIDLIKKTREQKKLTKEQLQDYFTKVENHILTIDEDIKKGNFLVKPISNNVCTYCDYQNICRKEELS